MRLKRFFLLSLITLNAHAFRLDPMSATIELKDGQTHFNFVLQNETTTPLPVQISVFARDIKENGEDVLTETNEISIYPDQIIIPPEQKRSVKVVFNGDKKGLKIEKAFRFIAEQLPVDLKKKKTEKAGIKMLLKYLAALYVNPEGTESDVNCELSGTDLICQNSGTKHQITVFKSLQLESGANKVSFSKDDLKKISGENILPGKKRIFSLGFKEEVKKLKGLAKVSAKFE